MIALKDILVATDFGEASRQALRYGAEFARAFGGRLHVLHVVEDIVLGTATAMGTPPLDMTSVQASLEQDASRELQQILATDIPRDVEVVPVIIRDSQPGRGVLAYAREHKTDLLVIGTHGRAGLAEFFLGSVAQRIVRSAPCPVLTVRAHEREFLQPDPGLHVAAGVATGIR